MPEALPALTTFDGILFDLDGVLTPTAEIHMRAWHRVFDDVFTELGITPAYTDADYFAHVDGKKRYDGVADMLRSRNIEMPWGAPSDPPEAATVCGIGNRKNAAFEAALQGEGIAPYPGSLALITYLAEQGIPMGVVSSSKNAPEVLAIAKIDHFFRVVVDGAVAEKDGLASKPAADMFRAGAERLGVDPARAAAVEDAVSGAASAAASGYSCVIGVDRGAGEQALLDAGATIVVRDLAALVPGAALA
ncbi:HAD family hydrolase [Microbacterium sp. YY-01]|uniref:HAD family hydrolase n=1 Tax=Microbacterium sp. YY-01 TaxID=3421634 RepID=UPI003D17DE27